MESRIVLGYLGALFCGVAATCLAGWLLHAKEHYRQAAALSEEKSLLRGHLQKVLLEGCSITMPVGCLLLRNVTVATRVDEGVHFVRSLGWDAGREALLSLVIAAFLVAIAAFGVVVHSFWGGVAVACCAFGIGYAWAKSRIEKQKAKLCEQVPDVLRSMTACFGAGLSLEQALKYVASTAPCPIESVFKRSSSLLEAGGSMERSLACLKEARVPELTFVAVALDAQHRAGGSMTRVFESACDAVEGELSLARSLRVQTAQAKLSARIVTIMPFALLAIFSLVSDGFMDPFFGSSQGLALLALALTLQIAGVLSVRRALRAGEDAS